MDALLKIVKALSLEKAVNKAPDEVNPQCEVGLDFEASYYRAIGSAGILYSFRRKSIREPLIVNMVLPPTDIL